MGDEVDYNPIHVYVVDDEKIITSTLTRILARTGIHQSALPIPWKHWSQRRRNLPLS